MRRLLITGGAGFIGSNFVHYWVKNYPNDKVVVLDALTYAGNLENLEGVKHYSNFKFIQGSINDISLLKEIFIKEMIDTVVHFAAESHVDRSILGPQKFIETNINGTFCLLETARHSWLESSEFNDLSKSKFVHISTDEVYGSLGVEDEAFTENSSYKPNSPYAASKASSDHLVRSYYKTYGLPINITNCSNNYGPYQFPEKLMPLMIINGLYKKPLPVYGEGKNVRDWLHVSDHCTAIDKVIKYGQNGETYNIGGDNEWSNIELVKIICSELDKVTGRPLNTTTKLIRFVEDRAGHDFRYSVDSSKIRNQLSWYPKIYFEKGLRDTIKWYIDNKQWWQNVIDGSYRDYYCQQYGIRLENKKY